MQWLQEVWELQSQVDMRVSFKRCTFTQRPRSFQSEIPRSEEINANTTTNFTMNF